MMKIQFKEPKAGFDSQDMYIDGKFAGYRGVNTGAICLQHCPKCDRENYAMSVASGQCAWCGWDVNEGMEDDGIPDIVYQELTEAVRNLRLPPMNEVPE